MSAVLHVVVSWRMGAEAQLPQAMRIGTASAAGAGACSALWSFKILDADGVLAETLPRSLNLLSSRKDHAASTSGYASVLISFAASSRRATAMKETTPRDCAVGIGACPTQTCADERSQTCSLKLTLHNGNIDKAVTIGLKKHSIFNLGEARDYLRLALQCELLDVRGPRLKVLPSWADDHCPLIVRMTLSNSLPA